MTVFWTWVLSAAFLLRQTILPHVPLLQTPADYQLSAEPVRFHATDGVALEGWKVVTDPQQLWIILCHGLGSNRADLLPIAQGLARAGLNLFLFDFRGHGTSAGHSTSFGWTEQRDLEGALVWLGQQEDIAAKPYGLYGISMGAAVGLMVAARDERIGAIVGDSPYTDLDASFARHMKLLYPWLPRQPFLWCVSSAYRLRFGVWPQALSPLQGATRLTPRPLLLIQGSADLRTPLDGAQEIIQNASQPSRLWVLEGAGHLESFHMSPQVYLKRLADFFRSNLL